MSNVITLTEALDRYVYNKNESGSSNRGNALVGNAAKSGTQITVRNPDNSAYAQNAKDRYNETQRPWYKIGAESEQNADNSAHAQKEKDSYVTDNLLYHQWEQQQKGLKADLSAHAQTAAAKGLKSALIEVATEKIAGPFEKAYGKTALSSSINKAVDKLNASGLLKWAADTAGEGFEEGMSDVLNTVADHIMGWDSGENTVWGDIAADKDEILYDMLLGAFVGAFGSAGNIVGNRATAAPAEQTAPVQQNTYEAFENIWGKKKEADSASQDRQTPISRGYQPTSDSGATLQATPSATTPGVVADKSASTFTSETAEPVAQSDTSLEVSDDISSDVSIPTDTQNVKQNFAAESPTLAQQNTAPTQETGSIKETSNEVVTKLKNSIPAIQQEPIVATLSGNEFAKGEKKLTEQLGDFFKSFGNKVFRSGLGNVILDERGVKSDIAHGLGRAKSLTFAAVPDVIATGKQIDFQENWKDRGYDSYIFAAPVKIGDQTSYVAAVVLSDSNNRFYLHEVVDENGNMIYSTKKVPSTSRPGSPQNGITGVEETNSATPIFASDGTSALSGDLETVANKGATNAVSDDISSDTSISTASQNVKQNFAAESPTLAQKNTAPMQETEKKPLSMADYVDKNSSIWNNLDYNDTAAQTKAMREAHERMTAEGRVVKIPESTQKKTAESFPDLRGMKKSERTPILKQKMAELKSDIRQFLNGLKGGSFEFEVNGNVLEAKLYDTGIKEVLEKITQDKANMLNHSDLIFDNAEYLYSLPDYDGNPNVYRWNYFYTPVQIGDSTAGVRIALRDMKQTDSGKTESQIYNWGIKKTPALDGGSPEKTSLSTGVSSAGVIDTTSERYAVKKTGFSQADVMSVSDDISSDTSISTASQNVKQNFAAESSTLAQKNTAPMQETGSTIINDNPATHTAEEMKRIEEYKAAVDDNLVNYIETVRNNPGAKIGRYSLKPVSERAANDIKAITGVDVSGSKTSIEPRMIDHIFKDHGEHGKSDHSMRDINDIARVQYVLDNYDKIEDGGRSTAYQTVKPNGRTGQARTVKFSKAVDGTYYVVEAVPDTKAKTVFVVTTYLANKKTGDMQTANAEATRVTSETENAQSPVYETSSRPGTPQSGIASDVSDTSIPTDTQNVKQNFAGNGATRERGVSKNVRTDTAMEKNLRESFEQSPEMYSQLTNKETLAKAKEIYANGYEHARSEVERAIGKGKEGYKIAPEIVPLAKMVSNELTRRGEVEAARGIMADIALEATAAGQFNQAQRIMRNSDPVTALMSMEKLVEEVNAEFKKNNPKSNWQASLAEAEKKRILSTDFTEDGAWESVYEAVAERIGKEMPSTMHEKITELRRMNMLLRPRTMIKNVASNIPMIGLRKGAETLSAGIQSALVKTGRMDKSERTRGFASKEQRQLAKAYYEANKADINGQSNKWDFKSMLREHKTVFKGGAIEKAVNKMTGAEVDSFAEALRQTTYNLLERGDAPFVKSAFVDSLAQYCAAKGITNAENITPEAVQFATANAMEATFKNANLIAKAFNEIKRKRPAFGMAIDILMPFTTTPANILRLTFDYSPAGFVKLATSADIASKIDAFSKASIGSALMLLGYAARNMGWITGGEDDDKDKAALDRATGQGTYSIGGKVSYDWAQPVGSLLAIGAEISDAVKGQESWGSAFLNALYTGGDSILNTSLFQNILSVLKGKGTSASEQIIDAIMNGGITQLIPGLAGDIAKIIDENVRSTYTGGNAFQNMGAKALAMIPGFSKLLPESVNVKGETNTRGNVAERVLNTLINPTNITYGERNAVDEELYRLIDKTGSKTFLPSVSPYNIEYDQNEYRMTGKEREVFQKTQGQTYYELANSLLDSEIYKALTDDEKAATLNAIRDYSLSEAKRQFIEGRNAEYTSTTDGVSDLPDSAEYFAAKQALTSAGRSKATTATYNALDTAIEYWNELSQGTRSELQNNTGLHVNQLLYADNLGIDSKTWYNIRENIQADSGVDAAVAVSKYFAGDDEEKLNMLKTANSKTVPNSDTGKTSSIVRRYEAALNYGISFDDWTRLEEAVAAQPSNNKQNIYNAAAQALPDYPSYKIYDLYKKDSSNEKKVTMVDDYWQQLIENAGKAAAEKP